MQFTEAQQKEQLAKLAMARQALATAPATKRFKFISGVNSQVWPPCLVGPCCEGQWRCPALSVNMDRSHSCTLAVCRQRSQATHRQCSQAARCHALVPAGKTLQ